MFLVRVLERWDKNIASRYNLYNIIIKKERKVIYIKYMGSKSRIKKRILPIIQNYIDKNNVSVYVEPFVGGANVIDGIDCKKRIGCDYNKYLIALLKRVRDDLPLLDEVPRELYNEVRANKDSGKYEDWFVGNVGFLASYNGRWFDGGYAKSGYEKTKNGERLRDYYQESKRNILKQSKLLKDIDFHHMDYMDLNISDAVIYCDPPYEDTKKYANSQSFNHKQFWDTVRKWSETNVVIVSEENAPDDFECIWQQEVSRSIKATDKTKSVEKLFTHKSKI